MNAKTQIIALLLSFLYGFIFAILARINAIIVNKQKRYYRSFITVLFICNIVLLYIILIFKLNHGIFHPYFFIMMGLGYILGLYIQKKVSNNSKYLQYVERKKKK